MSRGQSASRAAHTGPVLLAGVIVLLLRLVVTGEYADFVKPVMAPFLMASAIFLAVLCIARLRSGPDHTAAGGHQHPWVAWLLLGPLVAVLVAAPTTLGAFTAAQRGGPPPAPPVAVGRWTALPAGDPLAMPLLDYAGRSVGGGGLTLEGRRVTLIGFVSHARGSEHGTWYATRLRMRCCIADAVPVRVLAVGAPDRPDDTWVAVTGRYLPVGADQTAQLEVTEVADAKPPRHPYDFG